MNASCEKIVVDHNFHSYHNQPRTTMHYFYKEKLASSHPCICGLNECINIRKGFREINDIRGDTKKLPNSKEGSRKSKAAAFNSFYTSRLKRHRPSTRENFKKQQNQEVDNVEIKKEVYCAYWHYDKKILQHMSDNNGLSSLPNKMDLNVAEDSGFYGVGGGFCYSKADVYNDLSGKSKDTHIALVPTCYNVGIAQSDLDLARMEKESKDRVEKAKKEQSILSNSRTARQSVRTRTSIETTSTLFQSNSVTINDMGCQSVA